MEQKAGAQIGKKAFIQSLIILFILMMAAGVLSRIIPAGSYQRNIQEGREVIDPQSFHSIERPDYAIWRWFIAPLEVLTGADGVTIITLIVFILMVGVSFGLLDKSGILRAAIARIVKAFGGKKYILLLVISFFFMLIGAFFGIFEEVVPLIPVIIALSFSLGWDSFVGLGMSILATNMGFSAAITNPFTIGLAQKIAGLPLFSGAWFRIPIFIVVYIVFAFFLVRYAKRVDKHPESSSVFNEDQKEKTKYQMNINALEENNPQQGKAMTWFVIIFALILVVFLGGPFLPFLSDYSLPLVGLLFFVGGVGASLIGGMSSKEVLKSAKEGALGIAPGIPLILMASSVKYIVAQGGIMDTILHDAANAFSSASPFLSALLVYIIALVIEIFIGSASAKVFLLMPILFPLGDLVGLTRQVTVTAYCFGDGFTNMIYPTNAVLLISLSLSTVSYPKWLKWTAKLWAWIIPITIIFLAIAVAINFGPF
jgi:uncharacterized ion transporter superfamily protein YfcC